jgi:hypothetical protein
MVRRPEIEAARASLAVILDQVRSGRLDASAATSHRLEGALVALEGVAGGDLSDSVDRLGPASRPN